VKKKVTKYSWEGQGRFALAPKHYGFRLQQCVEAAEQAGAKTLTLSIVEARIIADLAVSHFPRAAVRPSASRERRQKLLAKAQRALAALDAKAKAAGRRRTPKETNAIIQPVMDELVWKESHFWDQYKRKNSRYRSSSKTKKPGPEETGQV
jgi:hypothetical protein